MTVVVNTADVPPAERHEYWADASSRMFVPMEVTTMPGQPFRGWMRGTSMAAVQFCELITSAHGVSRTPRLANHTDGLYFKLQLVVDGGIVIAQDGRETEISSGDFTIVDCSRPYSLSAQGAMHLLVCMLPHDAIAIGPDRMARITATRVPGDHGVGWLLAPFLDRLSRIAQAGGVTAEVERAAQSAVSLVENLCTTRLQERDGIDASARDALGRRIREFIDENLADPDLTPDRIAAEHYVSRRYLYKLFEADGVSVSRWIRTRRLERCRADLRNPALADLTVTSIAMRRGFTDPAHFSRLFRAAFGTTPSQYRRAGLA
jgi:AraC-like DNA-binding protein